MKDSEEVIKHNELLHSLGRPMTFEIRVFFKFLSSSLVLIATCICHRANLIKISAKLHPTYLINNYSTVSH